MGVASVTNLDIDINLPTSTTGPITAITENHRQSRQPGTYAGFSSYSEGFL